MKLPFNWGGEEALREDQELSLRQELKCLINIQVEMSEEAAESSLSKTYKPEGLRWKPSA